MLCATTRRSDGRRTIQKKENTVAKTASGSKRFPKGTTVKLLSGGSEMTVNDYNEISGKVECLWFSGKQLEKGFFAPEALVLVANEAEQKST